MAAEQGLYLVERLLRMLGINKNIHLARARIMPVHLNLGGKIFDQKILDGHHADYS
jgi:hypothetical protein